MSQTPTPKQALILWCLLGRHGSALQSTITPRIEKADRDALVKAQLVSTEKQGRSLKLTVTDKGWDWAGAHLREPLPVNFRVLQDWLERLHQHLAATKQVLADFIGTPPEARTPQPDTPQKAVAPKKSAAGKTFPKKQKPTASKTKKATAKAGKPKPSQLRARIEDAYLALTGGQKAKAVRLSALRAHLPDLDRATVDAGLAAILRGDRTARLSQFSDPRSLDATERDAAFSPAGEPFHIIWIES